MVFAADDVRWFKPLGECRGGCGKSGTGTLYDSRNSSHGAYCEKCANKRLKAAAKEREKEKQRYREIPDFENPHHYCGKE